MSPDTEKPATPTFARLQEQVAAEKALSGKADEKRELHGDGEYVEPGATNAVSKAQALDNPLSGISLDRLEEMGRAFAREKGLGEYEVEFARGAQAAQDPLAFESLPLLSDEDKEVLRRETTHRWSHPAALYFLVICCSMAAATQGMDESVINGANLFLGPQLGLNTSRGSPDAGKNQWILGLVNGAPYLCCAVLGCWLTAPVNKVLGRKGAMFLGAFISFAGCLWSACTNSWGHLLGARFFLGIGIGINSATVPVFAAETAPPLIRGALVMQWQVWTAFGIMLGTVSSLAFYHVADPSSAHITGLNWRLMLGSALLPALLVMLQVPFIPESPRWLIGRGRYVQAFESLCRIRYTKLQAARDLFFINALLEEEASVSTGKSAIVELFTVARNRRAVQASSIVMFMQQFCGINVIAYYSSTIFREAGFSEISALGASLGFGTLNWVFAAPAVWTIDTFGRRTLLLTTFPLMALFLLMTGLAFYIPDSSKAHIGVIALGIYLHCMAYSPGEGPVPFTYSAEAFPFYVRDVGMSYATALTWTFNFIVALTFPRLLDAFTPTGAFLWYAGWNAIGFLLVLLFVPETKGLSLEELDQVFSVPTFKHSAYQLGALGHNFRKYILRQRVEPFPALYAWDDATIAKA
ncbi:hypothetical protein NBRC10512_000444 [Rhodotorula toruloides]|uniref:RHTO0S04e10572g1_1 n=2 Tax=Rhodotorula toruloides TaxID=5286 RepID=A0A061AYM7_RHOTO|nr:MFS sugar transporter [Rhodotorula toruloides NP11]EMS19210.1 MFS sugar transporter [Rhodotorula toruloides NP11]CDR39840.1 RHTO0S04e10572g1_1 [Rhodotorula toruloides]